MWHPNIRATKSRISAPDTEMDGNAMPALFSTRERGRIAIAARGKKKEIKRVWATGGKGKGR